MGGICSAYGGEERRIQGFGGGSLRKGGHLGDRLFMKFLDLNQDKVRFLHY
jgi:hypothetical protein